MIHQIQRVARITNPSLVLLARTILVDLSISKYTSPHLTSAFHESYPHDFNPRPIKDPVADNVAGALYTRGMQCHPRIRPCALAPRQRPRVDGQDAFNDLEPGELLSALSSQSNGPSHSDSGDEKEGG